MRRRALLAASVPSGDVGWSFTLPLIEVGENYEHYQLNNDEDSRISELFNLLVENSYFESSPFFGGGTWFVDEEWLQENPIYINGDIVPYFFCDVDIGDDTSKPYMFYSHSQLFDEISIQPEHIWAYRRL